MGRITVKTNSPKSHSKSSLPPAVIQPDGVTCGVASVSWALQFLGEPQPLFEHLEERLHVRRVPKWLHLVGKAFKAEDEDFHGTLPTAVVRVMRGYGYRPVIRGSFGDYIGRVVKAGGVCLIGYAPKCGAAHWVACALDSGKRCFAVMDPLSGILRGKRAANHGCFEQVRARIVIGFLPKKK